MADYAVEFGTAKIGIAASHSELNSNNTSDRQAQ